MPQDKRRMYLLSERRGGRRPATKERPGDVRDRVQFKRKIKAGRIDREAAPQRRPEEWAADSDKPVPEGTSRFLHKPLKAVALWLIPLAPLTLTIMVFWPRCRETIAAKQVRLSCVHSLAPSYSSFSSLDSALSPSSSEQHQTTHTFSFFCLCGT